VDGEGDDAARARLIEVAPPDVSEGRRRVRVSNRRARRADAHASLPVLLRATKCVSTVGTEPAGIQRYSVNLNPLTYANLPHT
jgi:hypothetical protein